MEPFTEIHEAITSDVPEILRQFDSLTEEEPWIMLPREYRTDELGRLLARAADLSLVSPGDPDFCLRMLQSGAQHGEQRLKQGFSELLLFQEHHLLWQSTWIYVQRRFSGARLAMNAVMRIDTALALASKASLRGYHRPLYEELGRWPEIIDRLAGEWRPPVPPAVG